MNSVFSHRDAHTHLTEVAEDGGGGGVGGVEKEGHVWWWGQHKERHQVLIFYQGDKSDNDQH